VDPSVDLNIVKDQSPGTSARTKDRESLEALSFGWIERLLKRLKN
jgi:hypothetical protein